MRAAVIDSGPKIVTSNMCLWLDAAQKRSYSGSGTSWTDLSGNGNTFTLINSPTFDTGNGGNFIFNSNNNTEISRSGTMTGANNSASWSASISLNTNQNTDFIGLFSQGNGSAGGLVYTLQMQSNGFFRWYVNGNTIDTSVGGFNNSTWYLLTLTVESGVAAKLYVNTTERFSTTSASLRPSLGSSHFQLGSWGNSAYDYNGKMSFCYIYTRTLSSTEVTQNYNAIKSRFGL